MAAQIILVDDDPIVGTLTQELLQEAGFTVLLLQDSLSAQEEIKREKPALVVLDILMPGIDGLTLLHRLKSDPDTAGIRAIVVSGKSFAPEKARAKQYGAEMFIEKPYDVEAFGKMVTEMLKTSGIEARKAAPRAPAPRAELKVAVWGCRSSASTASPASTRYGRRTSCVSVELPRQMIAFDAGSGIAALDAELAKTGRFKELWLFLTHFHPGHVEGLAGLSCARDASFTLHIGGVGEPDKPLEAALAEIFADAVPACKVELYEMMEQTYEIFPGVRMSAFHANHPGATLGYALLAEGRKIVYCPDSEIYGEFGTALQDYDEKLGAVARGADLLIHDGRYADEDYKSKRNEGHSSCLAAVDFAGRNEVKQLLLVHQDADYSDDALDKMAAAVDARIASKGYTLKAALGREGLTLAV